MIRRHGFQKTSVPKPIFGSIVMHQFHGIVVTVFFSTIYPFTTQPLRPRSFLTTTTLKLTMPNIKTLTKELRQEIVSYLYPLPSISSNLAFRLAIHTFTKTRFTGYINFISRCLQHKVIPKGFRSNLPNFLHQSQQRPNFRQLKNCKKTLSRTHNKTRTTYHRSKSHHHYS